MKEIDELDFQLASGEYYIQKADELIKQYNEAKTENEKRKLLPALIAMNGKLNFQRKETYKYIPPELLESFGLNKGN